MRWSSYLATATALLSFTAVAPAGGIPAKTLKQIKAAAVYVKVEFGLPVPGAKSLPATGSGFALRVDGDTGYFVTNNHVVSPPKEIPGLIRVGPVVLVLNSGTVEERSINAEVVAADPLNDLAILKATGVKDLPAPVVLDHKVELIETMTVYAFGFPFGGALATGKRNPAITVTKGTISSLRSDDKGNIRLVQIDAEINPGNSGGPVVDEKGQLIGVAVSKIDKSRIGFAVPTRPLADMIVGRVASVVFDTARVERGRAEVLVEASLVDPLAKVKDVTVHYAAAARVKETPKADKKGEFPLMAGANKVDLALDSGKGTGKIRFEGKRGAKVAILYQATYVNADGVKVTSPPATAHIDFTQVMFHDKIVLGDPPDKIRKKPHKAFEFRMDAGKFYVVEMRGDPRALDPYLRIEDADGNNLVEDDDSGGMLNSLIVFAPPRNAMYKVIATVLNGTGDFSVRIREESGQEVGAKGLVFNAKLSEDDPIDSLLKAPSQSFNLIMKKGKSYTIDLKSKDFDPFLRLENMAGQSLALDDDGGGGLDSRLVLTPHQDGIFRVVATSFDKNVGLFSLSVRETSSMEVGADGLKLAGAILATDPLDPPVLGKARKSRSKMFEIKMEAGERYQIDLISNQFDSFLRVEDAAGKELASDNDSGGGLNARLIFAPPANGVYRVWVTSFDGNLGNFGLLIRKR